MCLVSYQEPSTKCHIKGHLPSVLYTSHLPKAILKVV